MWFVLDIGNSQAKGGFFRQERLVRSFRLTLAPDAPVRAWKDALARSLHEHQPKRVGIASVVPAATSSAQAALKQLTGRGAEVVHPAMRLPFVLAYETPHTLGADRLAAAAAAWTLYRATPADAPARGVIAIDVGTALTYEVVDAEGTYRGGAIGVGPHLAVRALRTGTAQLPEVPLEVPPGAVGRSTREALQSGIMHGLLDGVRGMVARISRELGTTPVVVATGGYGALLHRHLDEVHHFAPHLVLEGIRVLMALNAEGQDVS